MLHSFNKKKKRKKRKGPVVCCLFLLADFIIMFWFTGLFFVCLQPKLLFLALWPCISVSRSLSSFGFLARLGSCVLFCLVLCVFCWTVFSFFFLFISYCSLTLCLFLPGLYHLFGVLVERVIMAGVDVSWRQLCCYFLCHVIYRCKVLVLLLFIYFILLDPFFFFVVWPLELCLSGLAVTLCKFICNCNMCKKKEEKKKREESKKKKREKEVRTFIFVDTYHAQHFELWLLRFFILFIYLFFNACTNQILVKK